ncbi:hypothetical protein BDB01DRAFT_845257 [Pilobolus umbonatus]|nr:hypothetical protein BDB01DRAFT_845257 [Pilobolus umbonatus]
MSVNSKRKTVLPLHIDTTSFTGGQTQTSGYIWRRINKRQLPIYILLSILVSSLLLNIIQHRRSSQTTYTYDLLPPIPLKDKTHAIIVAGHAIYTGAPNVSDLSSDDNWILEPYQQGGQVNTFIQHIETGIDILKRDTHSVLIFSGGETRPKAGPISESYSYWMISKLLLAERGLDELVERTITEEYAKDSYENLLYSICRFSEMTGNYPSKITVVGFEFKRDRFESIHRYAIKYPSDK